ncbi:uncharacterized protein LOC113368217 [Ctenocephalides felis]|uniref:uncharacterized protein LOC113366518 n=1 Tax=Ctenocephalides felis TaxID=7515 RepID=UPI000E6E5B61|nr:uncharacterized protein LOC113366518 [Ctenocephalides felis]XP_026465567.1 uncharacterized protein LOC113368217 [Ctenocephalides felis]
MTPIDDFAYLINHVLLGEEPTIEDFILLVGTLVAFVAFILWCCFPIHPKDSNVPNPSTSRSEANESNGHYSSSRSHHDHCYSCSS